MAQPPYSHRGSSGVKSCAYICSRNSLAALNTLYIFLGLTLIGVAAYSKAEVMKNLSIPILGGVIACGVFILFTAILGLAGAIRHSQLSVSIGALAITSKQQKDILKAGWDKAVTVKEKWELQQKLDCCGFETKNFTVDARHPSCSGLVCCIDAKTGKAEESCPNCDTCYHAYKETLEHYLSVAGGVGLFFSFTLLLGVYLAIKYRNQKDPGVNIDAFL